MQKKTNPTFDTLENTNIDKKKRRPVNFKHKTFINLKKRKE
jgi:hypothetical protein